MSGTSILLCMTDRAQPAYELVVRLCTIHPARYRWDIRQGHGIVESSMDSFPSDQEAHADGLLAVERLRRDRGG